MTWPGLSDDTEPLSDHQILREIWKEVKRTNGRVTVLETGMAHLDDVPKAVVAIQKDVDGLKLYRAGAVGGIGVLTVIVVPIFLKLVIG